MKTAREIACISVYACSGGLHTLTCDDVTDAIEQARRDGAEWMREWADTKLLRFREDVAAMPRDVTAELHGLDAALNIIRALPVTP